MPRNLSGNIVLVGPARSGTTLACSLLNNEVVHDVVALDEPFDRKDMQPLDKGQATRYFVDRFSRFRSMILNKGEVVSTVAENLLANHYSTACHGGLRERVVVQGRLRTTKNLSDDFILVVKHTLPFTACLDELREYFSAVAVVRNPLAVLASWNTINASYVAGEIQPYACRMTDPLATYLKAVSDRYEKQVVLLAWHFEQYLLFQNE